MAQADGVPWWLPSLVTKSKCWASTAPRNWLTWSAATSRLQANKLMEQGVRLADPARFDLRGQLSCRTRR